MTPAINLMPESYRRRLGDSRLRQRFIGLGLATAVVIGALAIHSRVGVNRMKALAMDLTGRAAELEAVRVEALEINRKADAAAQRLAEYYRLALPIEVSSVLTLIGREMPEGLYVTELDLGMSQRAEAASAMEELRQKINRTRGGKTEDRRIVRFLSVTLTGAGLDGAQVAEFIGRLETHEAFDRVQLDFDRTKSIAGQVNREFKVRFEVNLEKRYVPESPADDAPSGEEGQP